MNLFYIPEIQNDIAIMDSGETHHCLKVLRMKKGDEIVFVDGKGGYYRGILENENTRAAEVKILESQRSFEPRNYHLHIAIAPTKNSDRFEWFLEKATEIGVDRITPILCEHSERKNIRPDRMERVILSAMKQSVKAYLPLLDELVPFEQFIRNTVDERNQFIAYCGEGEKTELIRAPVSTSSYLILIGPEGDFSPEEIRTALDKGFRGVSLGKSRLRTETAGVVAAQIIATLETLREKP